MKIHKEEKITVNLTDSTSLHDYYMHLIRLEREGYVYISEVVSPPGEGAYSRFDGNSITFRLDIVKRRV
ncbi:hypothetical protein CN945_01265 [Bacillus thuringiensis]|nr:hypothetical protein CN945_01265 [Bacillus thuringiensis]